MRIQNTTVPTIEPRRAAQLKATTGHARIRTKLRDEFHPMSGPRKSAWAIAPTLR
jgi:hypothetical protein